MKKLIYTIFVMTLTFVAFIPKAGAQFFFFDNPLINEKAPEFELPTLSGKKTSLSTARGDSSAIVFFWATWCPHCREQLKELNAMNGEMQEKGIKVVLIDLGEKPELVQKYVEKNKIQLDVILDQESALSEDYGLVGLPTFFFINKEGLIKAVEHSIPENYEEILSS
ncbi:MAG: TlpA family protein disulfide reductase [Candidatus Omnitrophica bacterium]|nr:TlpA family protein disulfide reductase [Candidatus Omnitrophota bacterium]MCB9747616.1 TlpA family protein disulfide reductase [Candidatus Omnitrophota bacterium]